MQQSYRICILISTFLLLLLLCSQAALTKATPTSNIQTVDLAINGVSTSTPTSTPTPTPLADFWITTSAGPGGTISGGGGFTTPGTSYTFTITPNFGYQILDVTVDGVSQGKISTYTLTNIQSNPEISATFAPTQTLTIIAVGIVVAVVVLVAVLFAVFRARKRSNPSFAKDSPSLSPPLSPA